MAAHRVHTFIAFALTSSLAAAQSRLWVDQFGTTQLDRPFASAPDGSGGVFVGGTTSGDLFGPVQELDIWLSRIDSAGTQLWARQFGTVTLDVMLAAASDRAGGVLIGGYSNGGVGGPGVGSYDVFVQRRDGATGDVIWSGHAGTTGVDIATAVLSDGAGGAFLCGYTTGDLGGVNAGNDDAFIARFNSAGTLVWVHQFGTGANDEIRSVTSDDAGGLYVCGDTGADLAGPAGGYTDGWLARFDATGTMLWSRQLGTNAVDQANAVVGDGNGGVFVTGATTGALGGPAPVPFSGQAWVARFDDSGTQQWITQFGGPTDDWMTSAVFDGSGGVFVAGKVGGGFSPNSDAVITRLDGNGAHLWTDSLGSTSHDALFTAASDGAGGLFVAGDTYGTLAAPYQGSTDVWVARFDGACNPGTTYCTASTTSVPGCQASIATSGSPSMSNPTGFTISSGNVPGGNHFGICFFGASGAASIPVGTLGGQVCVGSPFFRSAAQSSGGSVGSCTGNFSFTLQDLIGVSAAVESGAVIHAEIWARDTNPDGFQFSNAVKFTVCP